MDLLKKSRGERLPSSPSISYRKASTSDSQTRARLTCSLASCEISCLEEHRQCRQQRYLHTRLHHRPHSTHKHPHDQHPPRLV